MKNLHVNPTERNNYYSGMLLSEKDMLNEQFYMNSRRRLGNRVLHGVGVAGGLTVVKVDDELLSLEVGVAFDSEGREIIVDKPRLMRFNQINGYEEFLAQQERSRAYLCLRYVEEKMTDFEVCLAEEGEEGQYCKRIREGYEVYLTTRPLMDVSMTVENFRGQETILYKDENVVIIQRTPNFIAAGKSFETEIYLISERAGTKVELHLCESLSCVSYEGSEVFAADVKMTVKDTDRTTRYAYTMNAFNIEEGTAEMRVSPDLSYVIVNGEKKELIQDICVKAPVTGRDEYLETVRRYFLDNFELQTKEMSAPDLYLAEIFVDRVDGGCKIISVENVPFRQYVLSSFLQMGLIDRITSDLRQLKKEIKQGDVADSSQSVAVSSRPKISSGEYVFKIALGAKQGQRLISEEIVHGLGLGPVTIDVSLIEDMNQLHGAPGIFDEMQVKIDTAVLSDMSKGTFKIGVRLTEVTALPEIKMHWTAVMNPAEKADDDRQKRIRIIPDKLEMKTLQNYYLRAETDNLTGAVILWEVATPNGGVVSRDGLYTAPDLPGVYEISAFCQEAPDIRDSIFIIVRE